MIGRKNEIIELFKKYGHDKILFVGIDVSKNFHTVTILNGYYDILLKPSTFSIYEEGFKKLTERINKIFSQTNAQVLVFGCEPSGHYYLNIMSKQGDGVTASFPCYKFQITFTDTPVTLANCLVDTP